MVQYSPSVFEKKCCGVRFSLFVLVVTVGGDDIYMHFCIEDFVNEPMLLCDAAAPLSGAIAGERFRLSSASAWMIH